VTFVIAFSVDDFISDGKNEFLLLPCYLPLLNLLMFLGFVLTNMRNPKTWLLLLWPTNAWRLHT
jgi:hypothetical protein